MNMNKWLLGFGLALVALSAQAAIVEFVPPVKNNVLPGEDVVMTLKGNGFSANVPVDGGGLNLSFNPAVLQLVGVTFDPIWNFGIPSPGTIDNTAGTVTDMFFNDTVAQSGSFNIADFDFKAVAPGDSQLLLSGSALFPFAGTPKGESSPVVIDVNFNDNGRINVVPEPSTWVVLSVGILLAVQSYRRRLTRN